VHGSARARTGPVGAGSGVLPEPVAA
jgi:hypothetical protein